MFWVTLWPLVLGFGLSGVVQAFLPREAMERSLGTHRPAAVLRASVFGMVSSSCSYAAASMSRSLFSKGADFVSAMVFMFASTNLVIELGVVLIVLLGWQFAVAEFAGGPIMIALLALTGGWVINKTVLQQIRHRTPTKEHDHEAMSGRNTQSDQADAIQPWTAMLRSKAQWSAAASYTMADLKMLRRELVIGYVVAGFLTVLVPTHIWSDVFIHGHGLWTSLENVIVGPFVAIISFVCSIGNVPLAATLWTGGISFGGVISFIFADLIAFPLLLVYRKQYGTRVALRLLAWFWVAMSVAGIAVEGLARVAGLVPRHRPAVVASTSFAWDYTTYLNIVFLLVFGVLYVLYRSRDRLGASAAYATDPVCGMQVRRSNAPAHATVDGESFWFCSDGCRDAFTAPTQARNMSSG
jgi:uncharacterized membrane protein YraQ (UPF0718 family)/YHS domain-containing protein